MAQSFRRFRRNDQPIQDVARTTQNRLRSRCMQNSTNLYVRAGRHAKIPVRAFDVVVYFISRSAIVVWGIAAKSRFSIDMSWILINIFTPTDFNKSSTMHDR